MASETRHYRLRIRNQANSADLLVLSSLPADPKPYVTAPPSGDGQSVDPIEGHSTIGRYVWRFWDNEETPVTTYTITKEVADAAARNQMLSNVCVGEYTVNAGGAWLPLHTGYLNSMRLVTAGEFEFVVGDSDRREQDAEVFRFVDRALGNFPKVSCIIGGPVPGGFGFASGAIQDYGPVRFKVIANPATLINPNNRVTLQLVSGYLRPYYEVLMTSFQEDEKNTINRLAKAWFEYDSVNFATNSSEDSQPWGWFPGLVVEMDPVAAGAIVYTNPIAKEAQKRSKLSPPVSPDGPVGEYDALVNGSAPRMIVYWDTAVHGAAPAVNTEFDVLVYAKEISETSPLQITAHPTDILATLLTENNIPFDVASLTATRAAIGDTLRLELIVEGPSKLADWLESHILGPWGIGLRIKADGEREVYATRIAAPAVVDTVTVDDLVTEDGGPPDDVIFDVDEKTTINGVDYVFRRFRRWLNPSYQDVRGQRVKVTGDDIDEQTINLLTYGKFTVQGRRAGTSVFGERVLVFDIPGQLLFLNVGLNALTPVQVTPYVQAAGDVIIDRAGWGIIVGELTVLPSIIGLPGDYLDLAVPHQVNAKTAQTPPAQRAGTRKVQIVKRTDEPGRSRLTVWDAGNVAQTAPVDDGTNVDPTPAGLIVPTFTLAAQSTPPATGGPADPLHYATATVTNAAALGLLAAQVHFEYLVQTATPAVSDSGLQMGVLPIPEVDNTLDSPEVRPSGQTIWVKAQSRVAATGQRSAWSAWQSLLLGPALNGAGNEVAQPTLSYTIDSAGLVDVLALASVNVTKVKFAAASVGAAEATDAAVRAATADSTAPFEALNIFTLLPGEQRAVSAFAYDQFDNESQKATIMVSYSAVPAPVLTYTIDGAGLVDILANVGLTVTSVKIKEASVGAAEATDAAVRAATADTSAPFEALNIFTLAVGESRAVSAFAYDVAGNESAKTTVMVVRTTAVTAKGGAAFIIDGGGAVITTGEKPGFVRVPWTGTITGWDLFGSGGSGSIVVDTWKDSYANFPPVVGDSIWGTKPTITTATKNQATGLSIAVTEGDILRHNVDSVTTFTEATLNYHFTKS